MSSDILKEEIKEQKLDYGTTLRRIKGMKPETIKKKFPGLMERLEEANNREIEETLQSGDILFSLYPGSLFNKNIVTHTYIVLGKKQGKWMILQEWGDAVEIMSLEKLYKRVPGGIDAIARPTLNLSYSGEVNKN